MVLNGVCYPLIHFCRVILYVWSTVDVPIYRPVVARPKRTGKQGKPVYRGKRPHVHKKSRCISTDFDMTCLCFSCCRGKPATTVLLVHECAILLYIEGSSSVTTAVL